MPQKYPIVRARHLHGGRGKASRPMTRLMYNLDQETAVKILPRPPCPVLAPDGAQMGTAKYLASFSWLETKTPSIIIPGCPRAWRDPSVPFMIPPDSGLHIFDQDGYRMRNQAWLLPLFTAVHVVGKPIDWHSVDFTTSRNSLRKLLRWADGRGPSTIFRIDLELLGDRTILMAGWREKYSGRPSVNNYGRNFEHAMTRVAARGGTGVGYQRIVTYDFFGLKMVVQFEVDAYIRRPDLQTTSSTSAPSAPSATMVQRLLSRRKTKPGTTAAKKPTKSFSVAAKNYITIAKAGFEVPQDSLVELKSAMGTWSDVFPQLLLSGTPHLFVGMHTHGIFTEIKKYHVDSLELAEKRKEMMIKFERLAHALKDIQNLVIAHGPQSAPERVSQLSTSYATSWPNFSHING